jgi:hypothetical protein
MPFLVRVEEQMQTLRLHPHGGTLEAMSIVPIVRGWAAAAYPPAVRGDDDGSGFCVPTSGRRSLTEVAILSGIILRHTVGGEVFVCAPPK